MLDTESIERPFMWIMRLASLILMITLFGFLSCKAKIDPDSSGAGISERTPNERMREGLRQYTQRNYLMAIHEFEEAAKLDPNSAEAKNNVGMCNLMMAQSAKAEQAFNEAIKIQPASKFYVNLGSAMLQMNKTEAARDAFKKALAIDGENHPALVQLGNVQFGLGEYAEAKKAWEAARKVREEPSVITNLGTLRLQAGDFNEAEKLFRDALKLDPTYAVAHFNLGVIYQKQEKWDLARKSYETATQNNPDYYPAYYNLSLADEALGKVPDAIKDLQQFLKVVPPSLQQQIADARSKIESLKKKQ